MSEQRYIARGGFSISVTEAKAIGPELLAMEKLPLAAAVKYIQDRPHMALYRKLIWHDFTAADLYRQEQLKYYRSGICLIERTPAGLEVVVKSFCSVAPLRPHPANNPLGRRRKAKRGARPQPPLSECGDQDLLERAKHALARFLSFYCPYRQQLEDSDPRFADVFAALESLQEQGNANERRT
jgi:hypothetical protein